MTTRARMAARRQAAEAVGVSVRSVYDAGVLKRDAPDLYEKFASGEMSLTAATKERRERSRST